MENIANLEIGESFYSPVTRETYKAYPSAFVCKGCAFRETDRCCNPESELGVTGFQCNNKIYKEEVEVKSTNFKDYWVPGNIVILDNEKRYYIITNDDAVGLGDSIEKDDYNSEGVSSYYGNIKAIAEHSSDSYGKGFNFNLTEEAKGYEDIVWTSNKTKEMTIAEIEKELGMQSGTLRVKK